MSMRDDFERNFQPPLGVYWDGELQQYEPRSPDFEPDADAYHWQWQVWQVATNQQGILDGSASCQENLDNSGPEPFISMSLVEPEPGVLRIRKWKTHGPVSAGDYRLYPKPSAGQVRGTTELMPCPFCGTEAEIKGGLEAQENYSVWCRKGHHLEGGYDRQKMVDRWNQRAGCSEKPDSSDHIADANKMVQGDAEPVAWDDPAVDPIVSKLYRKFKDWSQRGFTADDVTWCEVRGYVADLMNAWQAAREQRESKSAPLAWMAKHGSVISDEEKRQLLGQYEATLFCEPLFARRARTGVPEGWKLVPIESSFEMDLAGEAAADITTMDAEITWNAMIRTAPQPPATQEGE